MLLVLCVCVCVQTMCVCACRLCDNTVGDVISSYIDHSNADTVTVQFTAKCLMFPMNSWHYIRNKVYGD